MPHFVLRVQRSFPGPRPLADSRGVLGSSCGGLRLRWTLCGEDVVHKGSQLSDRGRPALPIGSSFEGEVVRAPRRAFCSLTIAL